MKNIKVTPSNKSQKSFQKNKKRGKNKVYYFKSKKRFYAYKNGLITREHKDGYFRREANLPMLPIIPVGPSKIDAPIKVELRRGLIA